MKEKLECQSDRIEAVLCLNKIPAWVTGGTVTPHHIRFQVMPAFGTETSKITGMSTDLAAALDAPNCKVSRRGAAVEVEVPRDDPLPVRLMPLYRQLQDEEGSIPPATAVLGQAEDGSPLMIRLPSPDVGHILIAGTSGAGKTVLMQSVVLSLAMANSHSKLSMVLVGRQFEGFAGLPHLVRDVIQSPYESTEAIHSLGRIARSRARADSLQAATSMPVVLFVDSLQDLSESARKAVVELARNAQKAKIHVIATTNDAFGNCADHFPVRLVGRVDNAADARIATGWVGTGAERLMGRGDFLAVAEGRLLRFQAAHVSPQEIQEACRCAI